MPPLNSTQSDNVAARRVMHLAHLTLLHVPPGNLIEIASSAGFDGVTLQTTPEALVSADQITYAMAPGSALLRDTRRRADDAGLIIKDVQVVRLRQDTRVSQYLSMFEAAAYLGARYAMTVSDDANESRVVDNLGQLAEAAALCDLSIALEYMVYSGIRTVGQADRLIDATRCANIVLMVDTLHHARSGGTPEQLRAIAPERIPYIQLCDGAAQQGGVGADAINLDALRREALSNRMFPGEGGLELRTVLDALPPTLELSIEIPVRSLNGKLSELEIARRALARSRALVG